LSDVKRNLRVLRWIGVVPAVATCTKCGREFKVSMSLLKRVTDAQESLRLQFAEHTCRPPEERSIPG